MPPQLFNGTNVSRQQRETGTRTDIGNPQKLACEARGGVWDEASQTCIIQQFEKGVGLAGQTKQTATGPIIPENFRDLPKGQGTPTQETLLTREPDLEVEQVRTNSPQFIRDGETGEITGVIFPDGTRLTNIGAQEAIGQALNFSRKNLTSPVEASDIQAQQNALDARARIEQVNRQLIAQGLPPIQLTEQDLLNVVPQEPNLELAQALGGAGIGAGVGVAGAVNLGAAIGTAVGPVGTALGAVAGAVIGFYSKQAYDKRADAKQAKAVANLAASNFQQTTNALNAGLIDRQTALQRFQNDRVALYAARENLKRETSTDLNRFLSGGADELARVNDQITDLETIYQPEFIIALNAPNPANVKPIISQRDENGEAL